MRTKGLINTQGKPVTPKRNLGGHMLNPPDDCPYAHKHFTSPEGARWIDNGICVMNCRAHCARFLEYKKGWKKG